MELQRNNQHMHQLTEPNGSLSSEHTFELQRGTISISILADALQAAKNKSIDIDSILSKVGIPFELLQSPKTRISVQSFGQLWIELSNQMNDEFFGMDQHPLRRGSFKLLSELLIHSENLRKAIQHTLSFFNSVLDDFQSQLFVQENYAFIVIKDLKQPKSMFCYATYIMLIHSLMCWLSKQRIILNQMQLRCKAPMDDQDYKVRFCENIHYNCDENYIQFDANYLSIPIKQDKNSWQQFIQQTPYNLLVRFKNPNSISSIIRKQLLNTAPADWLEICDLAKQLNISEATFQRRLKAEAVSYQQLKNDIRRDIAIELLTNSNASLQQISDELDFHDSSAFHRAFKKWTGVSPGAYRTASNDEYKD